MIYFKVNGVDLDVPNDLKLSFQKKNILFSFDDIELSRSQGFTLPRTKVNDVFFGHSYRPDFDGFILRVSHEATMFYSGGAEIGVLSCKSVSDAGYDCVFVYGELQKLKQIKDAGNISEYYQPTDTVIWGDINTPVDATDIPLMSYKLRIVKYVNDIPTSDLMNGINLLPSARLDRIISECAELQGVGVTMPAALPQPRVILNTTNGYGVEVIKNYVRSVTNLTLDVDIDGAEVGNLLFQCWKVMYVALVPIKFKSTTNCKGIRFNRKIEVAFKANAVIASNKRPYLQVTNGQTIAFESGDYFTFIDPATVAFPFGGIHYPFGGEANPAFGRNGFDYSATGTFGVRQSDNISYNVIYKLKDNLPEVTLIDLLKVYAHIYNALLYYDVTTSNFSFFDGNFTADPIRLDDKLIKIEKVDRTIGSFAQKNKTECESEDYVQPEWKYKFSYDIANENLEKEKVTTKIPFSEGNGTFDGGSPIVKLSDIVKTDKGWEVVAKVPTIAIAGTKTYMERLKQLAPRNAVNDIFNLSTTIDVAVTMYLFEFQSIKPKSVFSLYGKRYVYFSGTWSDNIAKLVLIKIK